MIESLQPLAVLLSQNERLRDAALVEHQRVRAASVAAAAQAEQLHGYQREYQARWQAQFQRGGQIELVRCYQGFMERLTQAVAQQARIAEHAAAQVGHALAELRAAELRCASVRKLIERRTQELRHGAERLEQKRSDEAASRAAWDRASMARH